MDCTQVLESELDESVAYTYKVKVAELKANDDAIPIYSGSNRIGRDPEFCSVVFNNMTLSKEHAVIEIENRYSHLIYDLGSKNKTKLGKMLLKPHVRYQLTDKVQIQFGDLVVDYVMLPDEDGKPFAVVEDSDEEIIPGTPAPAPSKASTSSREESPTIFQMETECPSGYEETCARIVADQEECEGDLEECLVPLVENQRTSPTAAASDSNITESCSADSGALVENEEEVCEKSTSTLINEANDGDETDPEDVFFEMTQKPVGDVVSGAAAADVCNTEGKEGVEIAPETSVLQSDYNSDNINSPIEKLPEIAHMKSSECENENGSLNANAQEEDEDIFCMATQVIEHEPKGELEDGEKILESSYEEEVSGELEENSGLASEANDEAQTATDSELVDVCSKNNDDETVFKIPHAVQKKTNEIAQEEINVEKEKTEKQLESSVTAEDEAAEDDFFNAATQVIEVERKDSESLHEALPVENQENQDLEIEDVGKSNCETSDVEKITSNDSESREYVEEDSLYDAETQVVSITENKKVNSDEVSAEMDDKCEQFEDDEPDSKEKQSVVRQEDSDAATDEEDNFIFEAPTQVIHKEVAPEEDVELAEVEESEPSVEVAKTCCDAGNVGEKSDEIDAGGNDSVFEAKTQILENLDRGSVDIPSMRRNENEDDEKWVEESDNCQEVAEEKSIVLRGDDAIIDAPTQIADSIKGDSDPLDEDESEIKDQSENETGYCVENNIIEKNTNAKPETTESNLEVNLKEESICSITKSANASNEDINSFKVPATVKMKQVLITNVSSDDVESENRDTCEARDDQHNKEAIFEAQTQIIDVQNEIPNEEHDEDEDKNKAIFEAETQIVDVQNETSNEEHDEGEDKNKASFEAETQVFDVQNETSNEENGKVEDKNKTILETGSKVIDVQNETSNEKQVKNEDKNSAISEAEIQDIDLQNKDSKTINTLDESRSKFSGDLTTSTEEKGEESDNCVSSNEKTINDISTSKPSNNNQSSPLNDDDSIFSAQTQVISKTNALNKPDQEISSNEKNHKNISTSKSSNNFQSSSLDDSDDSIFLAPTQVIITTNVNGADPSCKSTNRDPSSIVLKENSIKKSALGDAEKEGENPTKESQVGENLSAQEIEDNPTNEDEFNDSFFDAPTQIFPSSCITTSQEEAQDQIKNILNRLEDDNDDDDKSEGGDRPKSPLKTTSRSETQEMLDSSANGNALNDSFFEASTQIITFSTPEESNAKEEEEGEEEEKEDRVIPTSLSRSSSYSSIHEAPTQSIDDLEISGQNLPVVVSCVEPSESTKADKGRKDNLERNSGNETLEIEKPLNESSPMHANIELVLPSTQELRKAGEVCYGEASDSERATTSCDVASPVIQKRTRNRVTARRGILFTEDLETVKPTGSKVSFANNLDQPSTSKSEPTSEADGKTSELVVSESKRRLRISTKPGIKKLTQSEAVTDKNNVEDDKSKKHHTKKSSKKGNESEDVLLDKKEKVGDQSNKIDDEDNVHEGRNKTMKRFSSRQHNTEASYDSEIGRPSRQRKMTWKARENCEENHSPDSKGKKEEKKESPNAFTTPSLKLKRYGSLTDDVNEGSNRRASGRSSKEKTSSESNSKSKPAENDVLPETSEDSNVLRKRKKAMDPIPSPALKDKKAEVAKKSESKRSKRNSKAVSASKAEAKAGVGKGQTTLEKWCESPDITNKQRKSDSNSSVSTEKEKVEESSTRSRAKHSNTLNSSDSSVELKTRNSQSKRKQNEDISETPKKHRRTRVALSSEQDVENKVSLSVRRVEMNNLPDTSAELKVGGSAIPRRRKQNVDSSVSSVEQEKTVSPLKLSLRNEKETNRRGRTQRIGRENDSSDANAELKSLKSQDQDEKKVNSQVSQSTNRRKTTRSVSLSSDQDKNTEETKKGRSKRSAVNDSATIPEDVSKHRETKNNKRKQDSKICDTPKKQRRTSVVSSHEDSSENVGANSRSKSKQTTGKSNVISSVTESKAVDENPQEPVVIPTPRNRRKARGPFPEKNNAFGSDTESKAADESSQDPAILQTSRNLRKARVTSPVVNQDESVDVSKKGRSKRSTPVSNSETLRESKTRQSVNQELLTPPRSARSRNASRETLPSEKPDLKTEQSRNQRRNHRPVQAAESDSSVCGSPALGAAGRKRKFQLPVSSTESDGQSSQGEGTPKRSSRLKQQVVHQIMFTGVICSEDDEAVIKKLGGKIVQEPEECSILITDKIRRTLKFLCTMGQGKPIVSLDWLKQSQRTGQFVDPGNFIVKDKEAEKKFGFQLQRSLKLASGRKLLEGYSVFVTPSVKPPPSEMKGIVENSGGQFLVREPRGNEWPTQSFIISAPNDKKLCAKFKKTSVPIVSAEVLLTGILQQKLNVRDYVLKL